MMNTQEIKTLMNFYQVDTLEDLVIQQANHVERLQGTLQDAQKRMQVSHRPPREG